MRSRERPHPGAGRRSLLAGLLLLAAVVGTAAPVRAEGPERLPPPKVRQVRPPTAAPRPVPPPAPTPRVVPMPAPRSGPPAPTYPGTPPTRPMPAPASPTRPMPAPPTAQPPVSIEPEEESEPRGLSTNPADQPVIVDLRFEGNALFAGESLGVLMNLQRGARLDPVKLDEDLDTLYRFFENVRVTQEDVAGGVILHFFVKENPLVVELNIYGTDSFSPGEIQDMMSTRVGYPLFPYALASDAEDIVEAYRMRGFYFAQVPEPVITTLEGGGRRIDFTVVEGPEVEVKNIVFRGNRSVPQRDLSEAIKTEKQGVISFLSTATFRMDLLLEDIVALKRLYESKGFLDAEVVLDDLRFSDDKRHVVIAIKIVEHQPYCVGTLDVEIKRVDPGEPGAPPPQDLQYFTEARIRQMLGLQSGRRYSGEAEEKGRDRIRDAYYCRSYMDARIPELERTGRERQNVVDLKLVVYEGAKSRLRDVAFVGNEYTRDKVLRREAKMSPGGYIDRKEIDRTIARLRRLGYFERVTKRLEDVTCTDGKVQPGWKDVTYEVIEGSTGSLNFGVGISTDGGISGSINFTKNNFDIARWPKSWDELVSRRAFTGGGQKFNVFLAPGTVDSHFNVSFEEPHLFGSDFSFGVTGYSRVTYWKSWTAERLGYGLSLGYPLIEDIEDRHRLKAQLRWRHQDVNLTEIESNAIPGAFLFAGHNELRSLMFVLSLDTVDDLIKPRRRTSSTFRFEYAGGVLGGDLDFYETTIQHETSQVVFVDDEGKRHSIRIRGEIGYSAAFEDTPEVPPYERFFLGGNSLRGFRYRGAGPHINGEPTGGEFVISSTLEYLFPVVKDTLGVVAFIDAGTLATNIDASDFGIWRVSVGGGIRLKVPMLGPRPLALDFGFPLMYEEVDERTLISFSIGRDF